MLAGCDAVQNNHTAPTVNVEKQSYAPGEDIKVSFSNGPGNKDDWIGVYNAGERPGGVAVRLWLWADGTHVLAEVGEKSVRDGSVVFDIVSDNEETPDVVDWPLAEGDYDVYFFCCYENDVLAGPVKFTIDSGDGN
jgi:hypothetical protein